MDSRFPSMSLACVMLDLRTNPRVSTGVFLSSLMPHTVRLCECAASVRGLCAHGLCPCVCSMRQRVEWQIDGKQMNSDQY